MKRNLPILTALLLVLLSAACDDDVVEALPSRYVYYTDAGHELQRYDVTLKKNEAPGVSDVRFITGVAANGIVLFEKGPGAEARLWGHCQDGSLIPVPMPVAQSAAEEYLYGEAHPALSAEGHHAAWPVYRRPADEQDSTLWVQELCRFDCGAWEMTRVDITSYLASEFQQSGFSPDIVVVRDIRISGDGSRVVFSVRVVDLTSTATRRTQHLLMTWDNDQLRMLQGKQVPFDLLTFNPDCSELYYRAGDSYYGIDCAGGITRPVTIETDRRDLLGPQAFSRATGEYIASVTDGSIIVLTRLSDGSSKVVVPSIRDITIAYPDINYGTLGEWAAVSPDGQWVAFPWVVDDQEHLLIVSRDGTDIRRVAQGRFPVPAVVSDEIPL